MLQWTPIYKTNLPTITDSLVFVQQCACTAIGHNATKSIQELYKKQWATPYFIKTNKQIL